MPVTFEGLGHSYGLGVWLFRELTLTLHPGRSYAVTGASGSGKSTLLSIAAGWIPPSEGLVRRDGIRTTHWVLQTPFGVARRSVIDHVAYPLLARGEHPADAERRASALLHDFELGAVAERPFRLLSGGEAQRTMLARATAAAPDLLIVDEPTAQLDRTTARVVNRVLAHVVSEGTTVIVATHDDETRDACDEHIDLAAHALTEGEVADAADGVRP
ncbi:MAG: ATP-binding cassette domain-containing protein [Microbacterium sp.]